MEPILLNSGTMGAGWAAEEQSLAPQTNTTQTQLTHANASISRGKTQEGASFSGPASGPGSGTGNAQQTGSARANSS